MGTIKIPAKKKPVPAVPVAKPVGNIPLKKVLPEKAKSLILLQGPQPSDQPSEIDQPPAVSMRDQLTAEIKAILQDSAVEIGKRLIKLKETMAHGEWGPWLKQHFRFSQSQANKLMSIAADPKSDTYTNLGLPVAVQVDLASPSTPSEARAEIIAKAEAGEKITVKAVQTTIKEAKSKDQPAKPKSLMESIVTEYTVGAIKYNPAVTVAKTSAQPMASKADPVVADEKPEPQAEDGLYYNGVVDFLRGLGIEEARLILEKAFPDLMITVTVE